MSDNNLLALLGLVIGFLCLVTVRWMRKRVSPEKRFGWKLSEFGLLIGFVGFELAVLLAWVNGGGALMLLGALLVFIGIGRS
jgi:hypothetical protein